MNQNKEIACTLSTADLLGRLNGEIGRLLSEVEETVELEEGYRWRLAGTADQFEQVTRFIAAERECCSFFRFDLTLSPDHGPLYLTLGGSKEIKQFISQLMNLEQRKP